MAAISPALYSTTNLIASATITSSTADSSFPASSIGTSRVGKAAKLTGTTGTWFADLGSAKAPTICAILNHNIPTGSTVWLTYGTTPTAGDGSVQLTVAADEFFKVQSFGTYRYWSLWIQTNNGGTDPLRVGNWWLGQRTAMLTGWKWGHIREREAITKAVTSEYGHTTKYFLAKRRAWSGMARNAMSSVLRDQYLTLWTEASGTTTPFLFAPDSTGSDITIVRLDDALDRYSYSTVAQNSAGSTVYYGDLRLDVVEEPWGTFTRSKF